MFTPRPSLLPSVIVTAFAAVQTEIGPELSACLITVANIAAATVLAVLGQRLRKCQQELTARKARRKKAVTRPKLPK